MSCKHKRFAYYTKFEYLCSFGSMKNSGICTSVETHNTPFWGTYRGPYDALKNLLVSYRLSLRNLTKTEADHWTCTNWRMSWMLWVSKSRSTWRFFSREQAKSKCDWVVMSSVFVASQSSCFFLCQCSESREQIRLVENRL